jgi:hypothetical protein
MDIVSVFFTHHFNIDTKPIYNLLQSDIKIIYTTQHLKQHQLVLILII